MRDVRARTHGGAEACGMSVGAGAWRRMAQVWRYQRWVDPAELSGSSRYRALYRGAAEECGAMCNAQRRRDGWTRRRVGAVEGKDGTRAFVTGAAGADDGVWLKLAWRRRLAASGLARRGKPEKTG